MYDYYHIRIFYYEKFMTNSLAVDVIFMPVMKITAAKSLCFFSVCPGVEEMNCFVCLTL